MWYDFLDTITPRAILRGIVVIWAMFVITALLFGYEPVTEGMGSLLDRLGLVATEPQSPNI